MWLTIWWSEGMKKRRGGGILLEKFKWQMSDSFNCYVRNNCTLRIILTGNEKNQKNWFDVDDENSHHFPLYILFWYYVNSMAIFRTQNCMIIFWPTCSKWYRLRGKTQFCLSFTFLYKLLRFEPKWEVIAAEFNNKIGNQLRLQIAYFKFLPKLHWSYLHIFSGRQFQNFPTSCKSFFHPQFLHIFHSNTSRRG